MGLLNSILKKLVNMDNPEKPSAGTSAKPVNANGSAKPVSAGVSVNPVVSTSPKDRFETDKREEVDTNTKRFSHYDKTGQLVFYHIETYDTQGRIIHKTAYNATGGTMGDYDYTYNADGKQLEGCWFFNDRGFLMKTEDIYDSLGRLVETYRHGNKEHNAGGNHTVYHFIGDTKNIEYTEYYSQWNEDGTHNAPVYEYHEVSADGRSRVLRKYNDSRVLIRVTDIELDEQGHKVLEVTANADEIVEFYNIFTYDGAGKQIENKRISVEGQGKTIRDIVSGQLNR